MRYIIGDTETTGLGPDRKAVEVALLEIDEDLNILGEAEAVLNPGIPIGAEAAAVHGITDADVADKPTMEEWLASQGGPITEPVCLIGYRVGFDKPLLEPLMNIVAMWDVLILAQRMLRTPNHKLQTVKEHLQLPGGPAHRAMGDVLTTYQLLQHLLPLSGRSLADHTATAFTFVHRMPFGKHAGKLLLQLPSGYRQWMLEEMTDIDPNLKRSLEIIEANEIRFTGKKK